MDGIGLNGYSLKLVACQHHELLRRVQSIRNQLEVPIEKEKLASAFVRLREELCQLRSLMDSHFLLEATGGYLEDAVARLPRLAHEASQLEHQHAHLLVEVEGLMDQAAESAVTPAGWQRLGQQYALFAQRMMGHEMAENRLLQEGFNEDAAVFD